MVSHLGLNIRDLAIAWRKAELSTNAKPKGLNEMKRQIHIQAAEGGKDSELFVHDLAQAFSKLAFQMNWSVD